MNTQPNELSLLTSMKTLPPPKGSHPKAWAWGQGWDLITRVWCGISLVGTTRKWVWALDLTSSHFCPVVNLWLQAKLPVFSALVSSLLSQR